MNLPMPATMGADTVPRVRSDASVGAVCYVWAGRCLPWCGAVAGVAAAIGLVAGLVVAPQDFLQGDAYRIVFVHVPAVSMSMLLYAALVVCALGAALRPAGLAAMAARALAPSGALMTFLALWTGSLWARPVRGLWWVWDARFAAEMLLLAVFVAVVALQASGSDARRADRAGALLAIGALVPLALLPLWLPWLASGDALHGAAGLGASPPPPRAAAVRWGLVCMVTAFLAWTLAVVAHRLRSVLLEHEHEADWVRQLSEARR